MWVVRTDPTGTLLSEAKYGDPMTPWSSGASIAVRADGTYAVAGTSWAASSDGEERDSIRLVITGPTGEMSADLT